MAFETLRGESGVDFIGTEANDALFIINETGAITADGKEGDDFIEITDSDNVVGTATIKGGAGDDTISLDDQDGTGDNSRLVNSTVNGGAGDDAIELAGAVSTVVRGNEDEDNFLIGGNYTNSTLNGNSGEDTFNTWGDITLSNTKILGGTGNDGAMVFDNDDIDAAYDSTINGSKGNDNIDIGNVDAASDFFVYGGQGNDNIESANADADGIVYSGDLGDDIINTAGADDVVNGGEGDDTLTAGGGDDTIDGGADDDVIDSGNGDDEVIGGDGNDTIEDANGADTITGGAGADTFEDNSGDNVYVFESVSDSAAAVSGKDVTFDTFDAFGGEIDLSDLYRSLTGNEATEAAAIQLAVNQTGAGLGVLDLTGDTDVTFADIRTAFNANAGLFAMESSLDDLQVALIEIDAADDVSADTLDGSIFAVISDSNQGLSASDMMFEVAAVGTIDFDNQNDFILS